MTPARTLAAAATGVPRGMPSYWAALEAEARARTDPPQTVGGPGGPAPMPAAAPAVLLAMAPSGAPPATTPAPDTVLSDPTGLAETLLRDSESGPHGALAAQGAPAASAAPAPSGAAPPSLPPALPAQIAAALAARSERPVELRMISDELGGLQLSLQQDGSLVRVALNADRGDTLDLLRRNGDLLIEELRTAGFAGATLSFGDGGTGEGRTGEGGERTAATRAAAPPRVEPMPPQAVLRPTHITAAAESGLHLRI